MFKDDHTGGKKILAAIITASVLAITFFCLKHMSLLPTSMYSVESLRSLYTTNTTRLSIVSTYCSATTPSISSSDRSTNAMYNSSLSTFLKANATALVNNLFNGRTSDALVELQVNGVGTFVFVSPYLIGLLLLVLASPFFLCCCVCQDSCPVQCCRSRNPYYSSGELTWPTVVLVLTSILLAVTAIPALTNSNPYFDSF